jgi:hypothetical protein
MNRLIMILLTTSVLCVFLLIVPTSGTAQTDKLNKIDTVIAEIDSIDPFHWTITLSLFNDETIIGISVPLKMNAGSNQIVADSVIFMGGRVGQFAKCFFRVDTAIQCVYIGAIANIAGPRKKLSPGLGRIATIYVSSLDKKPIDQLDIDTTTVDYNNSLLIVADSIQGLPSDTIHVSRPETQIVPAFVVRRSR